MIDRHELFRSFVPSLLINTIKSRVFLGEESLKATSFFFHGVCLIVDISGFTALSEGFCNSGRLGIDGLQVCTNGYIGDLVAIVQTHGGDIVKFAGDALICVFAEEKFSSGTRGRRLESLDVDVLVRTLMCAQEVRNVRTDRLTVHVGMSCGELCFGVLGGVENRWECLISGPCIHELSQCLDDAPSMQVVMTAHCSDAVRACAATPQHERASGSSTFTLSHQHIQYGVELQTLPSGNFLLVDVSMSFRALIEGTKKQVSFAGSTSSAPVNQNEHQQLITDALIRQFVPAPIVEELSNATGLSYFAEIREVVTMFMKWDSYDANVKHRDLLELQTCFYQAQRILHASGAYLRQFLVDDKGCVLIACWGMPNMSYLDNAHRALSAAAQIRSELGRLGMETSVGITCADVYCGTVGSMERMEYAAIGSEVNMAARLMGKAKGRLLVSLTAYVSLPDSDQVRLEGIDPLKVKGKAEPLKAFCYVPSASEVALIKVGGTMGIDIPPRCKAALLGLLESIGAAPFASQSSSKSNSGLDLESDERFISTRGFSFQSLGAAGNFIAPQASHPAKVTVVKGKFGTGKSCVATWVRARAAERSIPVISTRLAKMVGHRTPYTFWKKVFYQFSVNNDKFSYGQWSQVSELLRLVFPDMSQLTDHVSVNAISVALGVSATFSDKSTPPAQSRQRRNSLGFTKPPVRTRTKSLQRQQEDLRDALVKVFAYLFEQLPTLLIVENIHLAGERCLDLLVHLLPKLSHPSAVVLTAVTADALPSGAAAVQLIDERSTSATAIQISALESLPWYMKYRLVILSRKAVNAIVLSNYTQQDIAAMLCRILDLSVAPPEVVQLVQDFSGGSYFWVNELLQFIKEHGADNFLSAVSADTASPLPQQSGSTRMLRHRQPSSVSPSPLRRSVSMAKNQFSAPAPSRAVSPYQAQLDKLVLVRFGGLSPETQRILRTASVIGASFAIDVLHAALPAHLQLNMRPSLQTLVDQLWLQQDIDNDQLYIFLHPHAQQVIYELTPSSERNVLYAQIAGFVEEKHGDDPVHYTALSHYYLHCDTDKALQYAVKATAVLLEVHTIYDFADAITLLQNSVQACASITDVKVVQRLCENCLAAIESFNITVPNVGSTMSLCMVRYFANCWFGRDQSRVEPYGAADSVLLEDNAQAARAEFIGQLTEIYAALGQSAPTTAGSTPDTGRPWQVDFLA